MTRWFEDTMRPLVEKWVAALASELGLDVPRDIFRDPASEAEITTAERRLGVRFPPSYRAFLRISDGANASSVGAETEGGDDRFGFLPVAEVVPFAEAEPEWLEVWMSEAELVAPALDVGAKPGEAVDVAFPRRWRGPCSSAGRGTRTPIFSFRAETNGRSGRSTRRAPRHITRSPTSCAPRSRAPTACRIPPGRTN